MLKKSSLFVIALTLLAFLLVIYKYALQNSTTEVGVVKKVPKMELILSSKDLEEFDKEIQKAKEVTFRKKTNAVLRNAKMFYMGDKFKIKVGLHGATRGHWENPKKSLYIKIRGKSNSIEGIYRFSLITPQYRNYITPLYSNIFSDFLGLLRPKTKLVRVYLNGFDYGYYYLEEKIDKGFLERNNISNNMIIKLTDNWAEDHYTNLLGVLSEGIVGGSHITPFDLEVSNLANIKGLYPEIVRARLKEFFAKVRSLNFANLDQYIDLEEFAKHEAYRAFFSEYHDVSGDNLRMSYSLTDGLLRPIVRHEGGLETLKLMGGSYLNKMNEYDNMPIPLMRFLNSHPKYQYYKFKYMQEVLDKYESEIRPQIQNTISKYSGLFVNEIRNSNLKQSIKTLRDLIKNPSLNPFNRHLEILDFNVQKIRETIKASRIYIHANKNKSNLKLEVIADSVAPVAFKKLEVIFKNQLKQSPQIEYTDFSGKIVKKNLSVDGNRVNLAEVLTDNYFVANIDDNLKLIPRRYVFNLSNMPKGSIVDTKIEVIRSANSKLISGDDIYFNISDAQTLSKIGRNSSIQSFLSSSQKFLKNTKLENNKLIFNAGTHTIDKNVIIPEGLVIEIQKGATFIMSPAVSLLSYSPVHFLGTKEKKIFIKAKDEAKPFGVFVIVGRKNKRHNLNVKYVDVSGGSEATLNGVFASGGLSFFHVNGLFEGLNIHSNMGDDGLNIKYGKILLKDSSFYGNFADQVDLDFCTGIVINSKFSAGGSDNGDGLDVSGSYLGIKNNIFKEFKDKGLSIGENSHVAIQGNQVLNSNIGVAVKDKSKAYVFNNHFNGNKVVYSLYQKKQIFGGSTAFELENTYVSNEEMKNLDKKSSFKNIEANANKVKEAFLNETLYSKDFFKKLFSLVQN